MTARLICTVDDEHPEDQNNWKLQLEFKVQSKDATHKELTLAISMGALLGNMGDPVFQKLIGPYIDKHWDDVLNSADLNMQITKPRIVL